jgi:hypothetical protein
LKRPLELITALMLLVIAAMGRAFFATEPAAAWTVRVVATLYALFFVWRAFKPPSSHPLGVVQKLAYVVVLTPLSLFLGLLSGHGLVLLYIFTPTLLKVLALCVPLTLITSVWLARRGRLSWVACRGVATAIVFAGAMSYVAMCMYIWAQPDLATCHQVAEHPAVTRLTPDSYVEQRSVPYEMVYMAEAQRIAASFKMAGNLSIGIWDDPIANRLVVIDVSDRANPVLAELALEGDPLPQYMTLGPQGDVMVVSRLGYHRHLLDYVDLSGFPTLRLDKRLETVAQPHAIQLVDGERLMLATMRREVALLDYHTGVLQSLTSIRTWFATPGFTITDLVASPNGHVCYASLLGTDIARLDSSRGEVSVRSRHVGFGAGELVHDPDEPQLYQTDFFQDSLRVVDSRTLDTVRETALGFTPRPVAVAPGRDLLAVGAWLEGVVHFLRRSTGEHLALTIPVGPYMRELAVDDERGLLFAASKCGLYLIDLEALDL